MSNTIRIRTTPNSGDKYIKVNLEQDFDFIEILSLKISQEEAYTKFCSDYGVIVGRVTVNNGFGVPNAKVSVFIPLDDLDKNNSEIKNIYPFEVITDKTEDGKRYNLLPKSPLTNNECFTEIGSFPNKREILDNPTMLEVYCKYYKYTTTTNHAGDFMIFGVPLGTYTVHVDADISDIGIISQRPYDLISQGTPEKMFDSPTKFKGGNNLDKLIQIKTTNIGVNVEPFWGDTDNCKIGITRLDIPLNHTIIPSAIFTGSIFGDNEKHSVNKQCRPRKRMGKLCEQTTGMGTIEMIRKDFSGNIERYDVDGGRLIDEDGTWSYQVPMNLDYMVTDEFGNLIYVNDPNVGIPTRASVRFRIGIDETGGEGKKRLRAKYLVPNNPTKTSEIDYNFGPATNDSRATLDTSFYDLYWNKIYTVKNFIARYQKNKIKNTNSFVGIKDVNEDSCSGVNNTFPYNRINTELHFFFPIIALFINIMISIVSIINAVLITALNVVIWILRSIIKILNLFIGAIISGINLFLPASSELNKDDFKLPLPSYIPCIPISSTCGNEDGHITHFAPGCIKNGDNYQEVDNTGGVGGGFLELENKYGVGSVENTGLSNCLVFQVAVGLNMFQFDFYNDWINGTLYAFLLKYKRRKQNSNSPGREKFCEYDCDEFSNFGSQNNIDYEFTGVDSNENGNQDNSCNSMYLVDTCSNSGTADQYNKQNDGPVSRQIREGVIKKVNDDFYYASTTHNVDLKLFATDMVCLGSIFECDWQGIPKINQLLVPTTFSIPPAVSEEDVVNNTNMVVESGMVFVNNNLPYLFFTVDIVGVHARLGGCLNVRHICEYGVNPDEFEYGVNGQIIPPDGVIGVDDIDDDRGRWFRDVFYLLNKNTTSPHSFTLPQSVTTDFNLNNYFTYDYTAPPPWNGADYVDFRGFTPNNQTDYVQTKNSYYFYFGLLGGKTSLEKMNSKYFTKCQKLDKTSMIIKSSSTQANLNTSNGKIIFSFLGGSAPVNYTITGINTNINGSTQMITEVTISNLPAGRYRIEGVDSFGTVAIKDVTIYGPTQLSAMAFVNKNASTITSDDGEITIDSINNGVSPYTYKLIDANGNLVLGPITPAGPTILTNIPFQSPIGYTLEISDSANGLVTINNLVVNGLPSLNSSISKNDTTCYNNSDGNLTITAIGGLPPYTFSTTGPNSFSSSNTNLNSLSIGTYISTITDSSPTPSTLTLTTNIGSLNPNMVLTAGSTVELNKQCTNAYHTITLYLTYSFGVPTTANLEYLNNYNNWVPMSVPYLNGNTPIKMNIPTSEIGATIKIRAVYSTTTCYSNTITINKTSINLPNSILDGHITTNLFGLIKNHNVVGGGGIGTVTASPYPLGITSNNYPTITTTLTDSVGCTKTITG